MNFTDALAILELPEGGVTLKQLKSAYKKKAFIHHPDKGGTHEMFVKVREAYDFFIKLGPAKKTTLDPSRHQEAVSRQQRHHRQQDFRVHIDMGFRSSYSSIFTTQTAT